MVKRQSTARVEHSRHSCADFPQILTAVTSGLAQRSSRGFGPLALNLFGYGQILTVLVASARKPECSNPAGNPHGDLQGTLLDKSPDRSPDRSSHKPQANSRDSLKDLPQTSPQTTNSVPLTRALESFLTDP